MPIQLYVFLDKDRGVEYKFEDVPAFNGSTTISFPVKNRRLKNRQCEKNKEERES